MVKNLWSHVRLFCMDHENPVLMKEGLLESHASYMCSRRIPKSDTSPDGYEDISGICYNEIRYEDIMKVIEERIGRAMEENAAASAQMDFKGMKFSYKGYDMVVIKSTDKHIDIGIKRKKE